MSQSEFHRLLFEHNIDTENRDVYLFSEINDSSALTVIKGLKYLDKTDGDINLVISSEGGDIAAGNAIINAISSCKNRVVGTVIGQSASMAVDVLMACDHRVMYANTSILVHAGYTSIETDAKSAIEQAQASKKELEKTLKIFMKKVKISKKKLDELFSSDHILDAETSLKYGFVDEIIIP